LGFVLNEKEQRSRNKMLWKMFDANVRYVFGLYSGNVVERKVYRKRGHKRWSE